MNIVEFLIPLALALGGFFAAAFVFTALRGQYDDLETPRHRLLIDDEPVSGNTEKGQMRDEQR